MRKLLTAVLLFFVLIAKANIVLSDSAYISLLTCEPDNAIYARFWHSAIRVCDKENKIDYAYNYGIFDFSSEYFIPKFIKGETDYILASYYTTSFLESYKDRKSTVYEQILNLDNRQKQRLFDALEENLMPENATYRYNFIYDNCATRVYDIICRAVEPPNSKITSIYPQKRVTYRDIITEFVGYDNWQKFGIDILIGSSADIIIDNQRLIAFPKYTKEVIQNSRLITNNSSEKLVARTNIINQFPLKTSSETAIYRPTIVCSILLLIVVLISFCARDKRGILIVLDTTLFAIYGLAGIVISYLMFFSLHPLVSPNYNILWLNPLMILLAITIHKKKQNRFLINIILAQAILTIFALVVFATKIQIMHQAFLPMIVILLIRCLLLYRQHTNGQS